MRRLSLTLLLAMVCQSPAAKYPATDARSFQTTLQQVQPGDAIILADGEWRDVDLKFQANGTAEAPITLRAATPGRVILTGKSRLRIAGDHLVVEGLYFRDPELTGADLIEFRASPKQPAHDCRLTQCAVVLAAGRAGAEGETHWINLYGARHRVDHCLVQGKADGGTAVVVWLGPGNDGGHRLDANYFGPRERLGRNGGEILRVGNSETSMQTARCVIERNLFERCNGELECISNKSCGNIYRENTFLATDGTLTLRHGNACLVENNVFLGEGAREGGGIRIIGEDHIIRGNYFAGLNGRDVRASICLMLGIPNSPAYGYFQVKRARIEDNTIVDCRAPIVIGFSERAEANLPPEGVVFARNHIRAAKSTVVDSRCSLAGVRWEQNQFLGKALGLAPTAGIELQEPAVTVRTPLARSQVGPGW